MKHLRKIFLTVVLTITTFGFFIVPQPVEAQLSVCDFAGPICEAIGIEESQSSEQNQASVINFLRSRVSLILGVLFVGIVILAVFIIISAGVKYIQSQGEEGKIEEANKAIKNVFIGLAILIVGVVGVFIVLIFLDAFNLTGLGNSAEQACIEECETTGGSSSTVFQCIEACGNL